MDCFGDVLFLLFGLFLLVIVLVSFVCNWLFVVMWVLEEDCEIIVVFVSWYVGFMGLLCVW